MRVLIICFAVVLLVLQYNLWLSNEGMREVWRMRTQVAQRSDENRQQAARNASLQAEVADLKDGTAAVEERARTDLGFIGPNETFYQVVPGRQSREKN